MTKSSKKEQHADIEQDINNNECSNTENNSEKAEQETEIEVDPSVKMAEEAAKWQDKYMRLSAEFDNYRKRTLKEKMELIESAGADVIKSLLTIVDDMERAVVANEKLEDIEVIKQGSAMIHKKLSDMLKQKGVVEIDAFGGELDTDLHEAIAKFPVEDDDKKGRIIDVVEKGYKIKDKVIRYAKVVVGE